MLNVSNGYTGSTTVNAGKLTISTTGLINSSSDVTISGGNFCYNNSTTALNKAPSLTGTDGTISGSGTIGVATTITSGNAVVPGDSVGTLTFSVGLTLNDGATVAVSLGTSSDLLRVTGGTFTGAATPGSVSLVVTDAGGLNDGSTYTVMDWTGATPNSVNVADFAVSMPSGFRGALRISGTTLLLDVTGDRTLIRFK